MVVTNYFQIGNLSAPSSWIAFMVGVVSAYVAVRVRFGKPQGDRVADAFFTLGLIWKFSILLTDFKSVLRSPMAFIYFDGGTIGFFLGHIVGLEKGPAFDQGDACIVYGGGHCASTLSGDDGCIERWRVGCTSCDGVVLWPVPFVFLAG